jgi:uncharacterized membrane protein YedE/YeeE
MTASFTPLASTIGGMLIGAASAVLLLGKGRVAGISGIVGGLFRPEAGDVAWRVAFVAGMIAVGATLGAVDPSLFSATFPRSPNTIAIAGLLVGFGTRMGQGCTSGHGVCGISRFSARSIAATMTFMAAGFATVFVTQHVVGDVP